MNHVKLLDCTLRDGAYLVDKYFGEYNIRGIIDGLVKARIDCIEIGFFQDEGFGEGKTVYKNSADAKQFIPQDKNGCLFTVLADCSRYSIENLDEYTGNSIDAVRECFFKEERFKAIENCKHIKEKGYKCFVQPVDILGYTDIELIEFIQLVNEVEPYCFSIVDTFGSMYQEDLHRLFEIINHNLISTCKMGFHSHNNLQMSSALSQEFVRMSQGKRDVVIDATISGMGRGAGNTPTELIAQYMVNRLDYNYDMDALLDIIENYLDNIKTRCSWGFTTPYFVAGCYNAHVNNISYLTQKNSICYKDIRYILNKIGSKQRKRYNYDLLEKTYVDYLAADIDDSQTMELLKKVFRNKHILLLVPGSSVTEKVNEIIEYVNRVHPLVISINFIHSKISADYVYMSNTRRYCFWEQNTCYQYCKKIITSNIKVIPESKNEVIISFNKLIKCGWNHIDNSALMVLRLLDHFDVKSIAIAGFDGYNSDSTAGKNYVNDDMELSNVKENPGELNDEIKSMLNDYKETRIHKVDISFITSGIFE